MLTGRSGLLAGLVQLLPVGLPLRQSSWTRRHQTIVWLLWAHVAVIPLFSWIRAHGLLHGFVEAAVVATCAVSAHQSAIGGRRTRALAAVIGLLLSSAILVHLSDGMIEMHFHFFVMVAVITLYQDWTTFLTAIVFVAGHHGLVGVLAPQGVFDHQAAWNGPLKWAAIHAVFVLGASAAQIASWRFVEDEYNRAESEIRRREQRFRSLIEKSTDGISVIGADGGIVYDSPSVTRMLGYAAGEREGQQGFDYVHPVDAAKTEAFFAELVAAPTGATDVLEIRIRHRDGSWLWLEAQVTNLLDDPDIAGIVANFRDVTERKSLEGRLSHQAFHDSLTGLANRALFLDRAAHALSTKARRGDDLAVLFFDLDDFKTINDGLGHAAGDSILQVVAERLAANLRASDTCARLGGDEFAVLLEGLAHPSEAYEVGARLLEALAEPTTIESNTINLNASLGIVLATTDDDAASLVRNADLAMYQAKAAGKGRYEIFERGMYDAVMERMNLKADLRRAVLAGEFVAYYQPIVDLVTSTIVSAEALVRWEHPERGCLTPPSFIDLAEETGMIVDIGRSVLQQACKKATEWPESAQGPIAVSVNLSPRQIQGSDVVADVRDALAASGLDARRLILEITESVLIEDPDAALETLQELKSLGVLLALDDFGTGYSSLSYLRRFPVDRLKIDKSFVDALGGGGDASDASLVGAIAGLGELLSLQVTAEGIERRGQVDDLVTVGCELGQGYLFAKAVPSDALVELLQPTAIPADVPVSV